MSSQSQPTSVDFSRAVSVPQQVQEFSPGGKRKQIKTIRLSNNEKLEKHHLYESEVCSVVTLHQAY